MYVVKNELIGIIAKWIIAEIGGVPNYFEDTMKKITAAINADLVNMDEYSVKLGLLEFSDSSVFMQWLFKILGDNPEFVLIVNAKLFPNVVGRVAHECIRDHARTEQEIADSRKPA